MKNPERVKVQTKRRRRRFQRLDFIYLLVFILFMVIYALIVNAVIERGQDEVVGAHYITVPDNLKPVTVVYQSETNIKPPVSRGSISYGLPRGADGKFKTYMDYRTITNTASKQYELQKLAYTNDDGFRMIGERYMVAVGTYYAHEVGKELTVTFSDGNQINVIVGDIKDDRHTDERNQYIPVNGNIVEFIVDTHVMSPTVLRLGDVSVLGLEGSIIKIEEVLK